MLALGIKSPASLARAEPPDLDSGTVSIKAWFLKWSSLRSPSQLRNRLLTLATQSGIQKERAEQVVENTEDKWLIFKSYADEFLNLATMETTSDLFGSEAGDEADDE